MQSHRSVGKLMKQIHDRMERQANNALRGQDLTMAQLSALVELNDTPERQLPLKELERILRVAQSTAAGIVARLEQKRFVEGFGDASDRRIKVVRITPLGEQYCKSAEQHMKEAEAALLAGLTETERGIFFSLLKKVSDTME